MAEDKEFWKKRYENKWEQAAKKEDALAKLLTTETAKEVVEVGLGAGTADFIKGSARDNGHEKGDADLYVKDTNIYVEVTGPLSNYVNRNADLWFRPDKIENAINNMGQHDTFLAHYLPKESLWRVIHVDECFATNYQNGMYRIGIETIRETQETYCHIPSNDSTICCLQYLISYIKNYGKETKEFCRLCGSEMVVRTAHKGARAGKQFWGCTAFPKCNGGKNID